MRVARKRKEKSMREKKMERRGKRGRKKWRGRVGSERAGKCLWGRM
jgi:hypothetical protein